MAPRMLSGDELVEALLVPVEPDIAGELVVVSGPSSGPVDAAVERLATLPCVVVGGPGWAGDPELVDATADEWALVDITHSFDHAPLATAALALHLRASERRSVADGLVAESALYSALQAGPEHQRWRASGAFRVRPDTGDRVRVERVGDELHVTLQRPDVRNALDVRMRDELLSALAVAEADPGLHVVLRGEGPHFCGGGYLPEFGSTPDPATAHGIRLRRSIGAVLHRLVGRSTVHLHGSCAGAGAELPAFAGRVIAAQTTVISLPELRLGLIPGAGGTVSLPARIGRHRTAWLAFTGRPIGAETARDWQLVDEIA